MDVKSKYDVKKINTERLVEWQKRLEESNATAVLLVGVGHGTMSGTLVLCTLGDDEVMDDETLAGFLSWAAAQLAKGRSNVVEKRH